jgi:hypothetical protein
MGIINRNWIRPARKIDGFAFAYHIIIFDESAGAAFMWLLGPLGAQQQQLLGFVQGDKTTVSITGRGNKL